MSSPCRDASPIPIARARPSPASGMHRHAAAGPALRDLGVSAGLSRSFGAGGDTRIHGTTNARGRGDVCRRAAGPASRCRSSRFATTASASAPCIPMAASTSRRNYSTTPGWIGQRVQVQWTDLHVHVLTPSTADAARARAGAASSAYSGSRSSTARSPRTTPRSVSARVEARKSGRVSVLSRWRRVV